MRFLGYKTYKLTLYFYGYRIVDGVVWFEVNDPWGLDLKYEDGTPYGASRFYRALEGEAGILESLIGVDDKSERIILL